MKGFNFNELIDSVYRVWRHDERLMREEFGDNWEDIISKKMGLKEAQDEYYNAQNRKYKEMYESGYHGIGQLDRNDDLSKDYLNAALNFAEKEPAVSDNTILSLLNVMLVCGEIDAITNQDTLEKSKKRGLAQDTISTYIKSGYNVYPLMMVIDGARKQLKEDYGKNCEAGGEKEEQYGDYDRVQGYLECLDMLYNPYKKIFDLADKLGSLKFQNDEAFKEQNYELYDKINIESADIRLQLRQELLSGEYDLNNLLHCVDSKIGYFKCSADKQMNADEKLKRKNSYQGLLYLKLNLQTLIKGNEAHIDEPEGK